MPNVRGTDKGARKQRPSLTVAQSAKRKQGYANKHDNKNKKAKAAGEKAKADFLLKMAGGGKKQPTIMRRMLLRMLSRMLLPIWLGPRDTGRGVLMPF